MSITALSLSASDRYPIPKILDQVQDGKSLDWIDLGAHEATSREGMLAIEDWLWNTYYINASLWTEKYLHSTKEHTSAVWTRLRVELLRTDSELNADHLKKASDRFCAFFHKCIQAAFAILSELESGESRPLDLPEAAHNSLWDGVDEKIRPAHQEHRYFLIYRKVSAELGKQGGALIRNHLFDNPFRTNMCVHKI